MQHPVMNGPTSGMKNAIFKFIGYSMFIEWLLAFTLVILVRLPYLLGDHVFFDGDEAIIGIMARDLLSLQGSPFYFYGQQYGFSLFETLAAALFTLFLGSGVSSLKLGGMLLFSLGIQRLMRVFRIKGAALHSYLLIALVMAMFPTWTVWATMLRGGYITAFVGLCIIIEQLLLHQVWHRKQWLIVGICAAVVTVAQVFFLLVVIPVMVYRTSSITRKDLVAVFGSGIVALLLLRLPAYLNPDFWTPAGTGSLHFSNLIHHFVADFWSYFSGSFLYDGPVEVPEAVLMGCMAFVALIVLLLIPVLWKNPRTANNELLLLATGTAMAALPIILFEHGGGRYLLGFFTGVLIICVHLFRASQLHFPRWGAVWGLLQVAVLVPSSIGAGNYVNSLLRRELNDMEALHQLTDALQAEDMRHGIVTDWQLLWQLNYLMDEKASFRSQFGRDRIDRYYHSVNQCMQQEACSWGIVGSHWALYNIDTAGVWADSVITVNGRFFLMPDPDSAFLLAGGFSMPDTSIASGAFN
jgi:hypothetical protein